MDPIPLSDPEGRVWTYLCGRCKNVAGGIHSGDPSRDHVVGMYRRTAEKCCTCDDCGAPSDPATLSPWCVPCGEKRKREAAEARARAKEDRAARGMVECSVCYGFRAEDCDYCDGAGEVPAPEVRS